MYNTIYLFWNETDLNCVYLITYNYYFLLLFSSHAKWVRVSRGRMCTDQKYDKYRHEKYHGYL